MLSLFLILTSSLPLLMGNDIAQQHGFYIFGLIFFVCFIHCLKKNSKDLLRIVSPNFLVFSYVSLSLFLGGWGNAKGYMIIDRNNLFIEGWHYTHIATGFLCLAMSIFYIAHCYFETNRNLPESDSFNSKMPLSVAVLFMPLAFFFFMPFELNFLGGAGDFSHIPKTLWVFTVFIMLQKLKSGTLRFTCYGLLILFFASFSIQEKREAIFLIFPIAYLELANRNYKLNMKLIAVSVLSLVILAFIIITMSVARGYGGEQHNTLISAFSAVPDYIFSPMFLSGFLANIEVTYFHFHAVNSIDMVVKDLELLSYGETFIKPLFIFVPRSIMEAKPDSILSLYTSAHDPSIREIGGSWTISIFSELFWNFHFFGLAFVGLLAYVGVTLQQKLNASLSRKKWFQLVFWLFCYMHLMTLVRGSGLDQYAVYVALAALLISIPAFLAFSATIQQRN